MACIHYRAGCTRSYISGSSGPRRRGEAGTRGKAKRTNGCQRGGRGASEDLRRPATVQRLFSATFQVPCYRALYTLLARFTRHVLSPLRSRLRSLRLYVYDRYGCPSRPSSRQLLDVLLHRDTGINGLHLGLRAESSFSLLPSFHTNPSPLSLNPRYPRADHLGNLSSCVDDIARS